ncbi:MAG: hypothetical protein L0211_20285 [Planctomycetaceae bacterium]|nr:hypothetical protein [Planctomycetaceae bacterium]
MDFPEVVVALAAIFFTLGWPMIWIAAYYGYQSVKAWQDTKLKRDMVARGYTAQEIVQVVAAKKGSRPENTTDVPPAKPIKQPAYG